MLMSIMKNVASKCVSVANCAGFFLHEHKKSGMHKLIFFIFAKKYSRKAICTETVIQVRQKLLVVASKHNTTSNSDAFRRIVFHCWHRHRVTHTQWAGCVAIMCQNPARTTNMKKSTQFLLLIAVVSIYFMHSSNSTPLFFGFFKNLFGSDTVGRTIMCQNPANTWQLCIPKWKTFLQ